MTVSAKTPIRPHFSPIRSAEAFAFVSGQLPFGSDASIVSGGIVAQTKQCLHNIEAALRAEGLGLEDIVKTTVWLSRVDDFASFNAAYAEAFRGRVAPARSTVRADLMVEGP